MTEERIKELLIACIGYIGETTGNFEDRDYVLTEVVGFTEKEINEISNF